MRRAYIRVSAAGQNLDRQVASLEKYDIDIWYREKISGKNTNRPELQKLLDEMKPGDEVYVHDLSRLARSTRDLLELMDRFREEKVALNSVKESFQMDTPMGKLFATVIGAISEFERDVLLERQREGIEIAKKQKRFKGGTKKHVDIKFFEKCLADYNCRRIDKKTFCKRLGVSLKTLNRLIIEYETGFDENGHTGRFEKQKRK